MLHDLWGGWESDFNTPIRGVINFNTPIRGVIEFLGNFSVGLSISVSIKMQKNNSKNIRLISELLMSNSEFLSPSRGARIFYKLSRLISFRSGVIHNYSKRKDWILSSSWATQDFRIPHKGYKILLNPSLGVISFLNPNRGVIQLCEF